MIINARLSDRSFNRYSWVRGFMRRVFANVDAIYAQTDEDAGRFRKLVANPERVRMAGNLKFDARPPQMGDFARVLEAGLQQTQRAPVFVAASTMPGEEFLVLEAWDEILQQHANALLILAPRHPNRFDEVSHNLNEAHRPHVRRTGLSEDAESIAQQLAASPILLLDTIGELAGIFELADLVFMGGSLVPTGGHNILEPAYWSRAIVFGPHMENFRDIARLFLDAGAAMQVRDVPELSRSVSSLLENKEARERMGAAAKKVLETHSGATARTLEGIREFLKPESVRATRAPSEVS
jgi:3-deoxy-D-manno-octulosonic-acid transferase